MYRIALERFVLEHGLLDRIDVRGATPRHAVPALYAQVDALVNDMRPGATDKVVYEAAATCLPVIASNPAFDSLLPEELRFAHGDVDGLAAAIRRLAGDRPERRSVAGCARSSCASTRSACGPTGSSRSPGERPRPPRRQGRRDLRRREPPAAAAARAARPRLGRRGASCSTRASPAPRSSQPGSRRTPSPSSACASRVRSTRGRSARILRRARRGRPDVLHTHLVHADFHGAARGPARARARTRVDEARLQRVPGREGLRGRRSDGRLARGRARRDLGRAGPLPRRRTRASIRRASRSSTTGSRRGPSRRRFRARRGSRSSGG